MEILPQHFDGSLSVADARALFARSVKMVEIETFTFCNRTCWFCPNKDIPQRQQAGAGNKEMPPPIYARILKELADVDYCGSITYSRYNEPLAMRDLILDRISLARSVLPNAFLFTHTNGDYLKDRGYLDDLRAAGLNSLRVQTYLGNDERWDPAKMLRRQAQQLHKLGLSVRNCMVHEPIARFMVLTDYDGMEVTIDARNFDAIGTDRGQLVQVGCATARTSPCFVPFHSMYIDWDGSVVPCCNLRSDVPAHSGYVIGNVKDDTLYGLYAKLYSWRKSLLTFGSKHTPCNTCTYEVTPHNEQLALRLEQIAEKCNAK